jgi:hypothetical protein
VTAPHTLTPADIMDLRASLKWRTSNGESPLYPHIIYLPADEAFLLVVDGRRMAVSKDPEVLAACLRNERAEPGYVRRVLDSTDDVQLAALNPAEAAQERSRRNAEAAALRARQEEERATQMRLRNARSVDPATFTLDDLGD